ncbi:MULTISPECIES: TVP38/TMEM64 family protein [unclassified Nodularia (in: cyanobacteria)]|uniref:TVP38/TMEM64 family protein n=1 Tax=unclassified Nodularia (in: cyanobacteria) TaxID=2656917 RepID=UPI001881EE99|nr:MULTISPECIES: TVP38/TMEM64 family protein [unclassified Nodularia (in: cyanobacteria)]MBE9201517.1 TVP38/TMEM64 family protein [Nodularia sp. LEGE 06071]MCC2694414.1 TVP38/TMEM64 family protein [Nodularia sp. LEGE 04288]
MLQPAITNLILPQREKPTIADILTTKNWQRLVKFAFLMLIAFSVALIFTAEPAWGQESAQNASGFNPQIWLRNALQWIDSLGAVGALAFILLYIVATVAFLPGSILTLGAGVVFGVVMGSIYVFIGATIGATAAFLVGRYLARGWVAKKIAGNHKFRAIDEAVGREGLKIVLLTRLSPIFPFNFLNYAYGVTGVSLKDYFLGSVGMIPGTIMYVYIGSLAGSIATIGTEAQPDNPGVQWAIRIIGFIATVAVTVYVTKVARKALEDEVVESTDNDKNTPINLN